MDKPDPKNRYLGDWDTTLTDDWIDYALKLQTIHCNGNKAHEKGVSYKEELFYKIDELILEHAFGASPKQGTQHSDVKANFNSVQCAAAKKVKKVILKYGKITDKSTGEKSVSLQVISVTLMIVDISSKDKEASDKDPIPGLAQIPVFRVVKPDGNFCFVDQTARYYSTWDDYLENNKVPRSKMCYPKDGMYRYDINNNADGGNLNLTLSESISCTYWERFKSGGLQVVSYVGLAAGVVSIVAAPFTGGAAPSAYAVAAYAISGWIGVGCMAIGLVANVGSLVDKLRHDESCYAEIGSIAMTLLTLGVSQYNRSILTRMKNGMPVTQAQVVMMTVLNCVKFGVDSIMFAWTLGNLVLKTCREGIGSITAMELVQFSMSAYFFGRSIFSPKTGYGIIKEAHRRYLMVEKAAKITDPGALEKYKEFVNPENRLGDDTMKQRWKDDIKGFTCSKEVCNELNKNADVIRNINAFADLNQFFVEVRDTTTQLRMTDDGNMMVNEELEIHGRRLNEIGETVDGINQHRKNLLQLTSTYHRQAQDPNQNQQQNKQAYEAGLQAGGYKYGNDRLFFEIDRRVLQETLGGIVVDGRNVFANMSVSVADRVWRVLTQMGGQANAVVSAATTIAQETRVTDPRQLADIMEFVNCKRSELPRGARPAFLAAMTNPQNEVFTRTVQEWTDALRAARQVLETADMPWASDTAAAYHYLKHKNDVPIVNAEGQPAPVAPVENAPPREPFDDLVDGMRRYLNEQWRNVIVPEHKTYEGHSQDGRTFKTSYAQDIPDQGTHLAFTAANAETRDDTKILSHYMPRN